MFSRVYTIALLLLLLIKSTASAETWTLGVWNLEDLSPTAERGFPELRGTDALQPRTPRQLKTVARYIRDHLKVDALMLSEIHPTNDDEPELSSSELDKIVNEMGESWTYLMGSTGAKSLAFLFNTDRVTVKNANELTVKIFGVQYKRLSDSFPKDIFDRDPLFVWIAVLDDAGEEVDDLLLIGVHLKSGKNFRDNHLVAMAKLVTEIDKFKKKNGISMSEKDVIILGDLNDDSHRRKRFHYLFDYLEDKRFTHLGSDLDPYPGTRVNGSQIDHIFVANHLIEDWIEAESFTVHDDDDPQEYRKTFSDHFPLTFEFVIDDE